MASRADTYRVVRCPNCRNILFENTNISKYPCSKCGRILHAKDRSAPGENTDPLVADEAKNSTSKSKIRSPDTLSVSSRGRTRTPRSSNTLLSEVERVNGSCNHQYKRESAIAGENVGGDRESDNAFGSSRKGEVPIQVDDTENFHAYDGNTGPKLIDESREFSLRIATSEVFKSSASRSPRSGDGSASSSDDRSSSHLRKWQQVKSRRTFRQRMMNKKQGKEGSTSGTDTTTADVESNFEDELLSSKSSNERFHSGELLSSDVSRDELSFRFGISEVERETLPGSEDFHSAEAAINLKEGHIFDTRSHGTKNDKSRFDATRPNHRRRSTSFLPRYSISRPRLDVWRSEPMPNTQKLFSQPSSSATLPVLENELERSSRIHYCRPILRGAPFIICDNEKCASLVQMPLDFVLSRKRVNKLKCGACFKVLELKFPARSHGKIASASVVLE